MLGPDEEEAEYEETLEEEIEDVDQSEEEIQQVEQITVEIAESEATIEEIQGSEEINVDITQGQAPPDPPNILPEGIPVACDVVIGEPSISHSNLPVRVVMYDDQGDSLQENYEEVDTEVYWLPDVHEVFGDISEESSMDDEDSAGAITDVTDTVQNDVVNERRPREKGPMRGRRRGHPRGGGRTGRSRGSRGHGSAASLSAHTWSRGDSLVEVCVDDDDVPRELRAMVMEVVARREARARDLKQRALNRQAREGSKRQAMKEDREREEDNFDADDGRDAEQNDNTFKWSPMASFRVRPEVFKPRKTGAVHHHITPYDAFRSYWDDDIIKHIVTETNRYASSVASGPFKRDWYPTNSHEVLVLFSFWMMLGIIRMPTVKSCFSLDPLLKTEIFGVMMTYRRYTTLVRALQFADNTVRPQDGNNHLYCFESIVDHLNKKFQANYIPSRDIAIDESITPWKGKLSFRKYIHSKTASLGIKTFELCESATGYLWSFLVYTGKDSTNDTELEPSMLKSTAVVLKLVKPLLRKGYRLFMGSWFNSPLLARFLKRNGTDCVGTLRPCVRYFPPLVNLAQLKQGQYIARHSGDVCVMAFQDKQKVHTISTCHGVEMGHAPVKPYHSAQLMKPRVVLDYNRGMVGVDRKDLMLEPYLLERKRCNKWYMKLFKRLLNCSILNSRILLESSLGTSKDHLSFRLHLVDSILEHHLQLCPQSRHKSRRGKLLPHNRLLPQPHWPVHLEPTSAALAHKRRTRVRCVACLRLGLKESKTTFKCETCDVPLCIERCFKYYHENL